VFLQTKVLFRICQKTNLNVTWEIFLTFIEKKIIKIFQFYKAELFLQIVFWVKSGICKFFIIGFIIEIDPLKIYYDNF